MRRFQLRRATRRASRPFWSHRRQRGRLRWLRQPYATRLLGSRLLLLGRPLLPERVVRFRDVGSDVARTLGAREARVAMGVEDQPCLLPRRHLLVRPHELDVDWYERIDTSPLERDGANIFGNVSDHARYKYLLSLEGHSYWSFRLRHLLHLNSAVLHQDLPCHEFWHVFFRPYEHYVPLQRDLSDLQQALRYLRSSDAATKAMVGRGQRLAQLVLSQRGVLVYVERLLIQYAALQTQAVTLHPRAVALM
mmetsp:Transcript_3665/g.8269  ORF Transcript_3665/g.8269 Transcript_3665/m.8269 type:complete len:250 (-) Transcript_3665:397-1146(-)